MSSTSATALALHSLNNRGIKLFQDEDLHSAIKCFRSALYMLKRDLLLNNKNNKCKTKGLIRGSMHGINRVHRPAVAAARSIKTPVRASGSTDTTVKVKRSSLSVTGDRVQTKPQTKTDIRTKPDSLQPNETSVFSRMNLSSHYVACKPITMHGLDNIDQDHKVSASVMTMVLVFNLALSHQMLSFASEPAQAEKYRRAAISFYAICVDVRRRHYHRRASMSNPSVSSSSPPPSLMEPCIVNNLGVLHFQLNEMPQSLNCFQRLSHLLKQLNPRHLSHAQGFIGNLVLMSLNSTRGICSTSDLADAA